ncbi:unnamed protein product [Closterium sp. NIES-64]|nr:unnamed protein product [Closterium sp. NIES-64]
MADKVTWVWDDDLPHSLKGVVNGTNSSTLSSTARLTATNTITPSSSSSASVATVTYECSPGCRLQRLANRVCDAACNTPACAFDGGDCACAEPLFGPGICACPPGHTRRDNACSLSTAVGANLNFPFSLQRYGPNYTESNFAFAAERGFAANRFVSHRNRTLLFRQLPFTHQSLRSANHHNLSSISPFLLSLYFFHNNLLIGLVLHTAVQRIGVSGT